MALNALLTRLVGRAAGVFQSIERTGERVPDGPVLVVANHPNSLLDPLVIFRVAGRPTRPLAKAPLFDQAFIISTGSGGPAGSTMTAVMYVYTVTIKEFNYGYGATVGVVLFLIIFTITLAQRLLFGRSEIGY